MENNTALKQLLIRGKLDEFFFRALLLGNYYVINMKGLSQSEQQNFIKKQQSLNELLPLIAEFYAEIQSIPCPREEELKNISIYDMDEKHMGKEIGKYVIKVLKNEVNSLSDASMQHSVNKSDLLNSVDDLYRCVSDIKDEAFWNSNSEDHILNYFESSECDTSLADRALENIASIYDNKKIEVQEVENNDDLNIWIVEFNNLFKDFVTSADANNISILKEFVKNKYMQNDYGIEKLVSLIYNIKNYIKENECEKDIENMLICLQQLRNAIIYQRDIWPGISSENDKVKREFASLRDIVKNQIDTIRIRVRNVEQNDPFKRTLFLINSLSDEKLRLNVLSKFNNPNRDCVSEFINNKNLHEFINQNPDKVEILMWGFVNQPKIFFNTTVSYDTKIKIFDGQQNSSRETYYIYGKPVVSQKINELPAEYSNFVVMIWDRANFFNCNRIVEQLTQQLLAELYGVVKKFDLNSEETKRIVDYFYRHRADFFNRNSDNVFEPIEKLAEFCQNECGFLTPQQKEIINSRPEEERAKFREAMKDPRFREICVDETVAKNLSCFLDDYQKYVDDAWFDSVIVILDEFDFGEDFYKRIQETDKKNYLRDIILFAYEKMMKIVKVNPVIYEKFKDDSDYQIALVKDLKNSLPKLREYMKKAVEDGIEGGDAAEQLNSSNDFLPGIDKDNKEAIYVVAQNISTMIEGLENFRKSLSKPEEFNDKEKGVKKIYRNDFGFFLKYYPKEVANCFVNLSADNEYIENVIENMKKSSEAYRIFKYEAIRQLSNVKENFSDKILLLSKLYNFSDIRESHTSLFKDIVSYINQNQESNEAKAIVKSILNLSNDDETNKEIKKHVLKNIPRDFVNECKDEIAIAKSEAAIKEMAGAIVNGLNIPVDNKILAKAIAEAIIQKHPENAAEVAQRLGRENLIGFQLYQNDIISQVIDQQEINQGATQTRPLSGVLNNDGGNNFKNNEEELELSS